MGKVINMNGQEVEVVPLAEAPSYYRGRKGETMTLRSFQQMMYRRKKDGTPVIPKSAYTKTARGNYWVYKKYLLGLDESNTAA